MGLLTKTQAAEMLGVSVRTIYKHIQRGYLRPIKNGTAVGVPEEDVLQLRVVSAKSEEESLPFPVNRFTIALLHARIRTLEIQMGVVMRLLGLRREPLTLTNPEMRYLYVTATTYSSEGWPPHAESFWVNIFLKLRHEDLEQAERVSNDLHPWRPFYRLAATMFLTPSSKYLREELEAGKANLYAISSIWCQLKGASPRGIQSLISRDASPDKRLVQKLGRREQTSGGGPGCPESSPKAENEISATPINEKN